MADATLVEAEVGAGLPGAAAPGWIRSPAFDLAFIGGVLALALLLGGAAALGPRLFVWVLFLDFWLFAYPHVAATWTRIAFERDSLRAHRFLLFGLPPIVLAATSGLTWVGGVVALNTLYFYWQSYHYTLQSYGISRAYSRKAGPAGAPRDLLTAAVVFAFPIWGVLHRAHQQQPVFYAAPLYSPPIPGAVVIAAGVVALAALTAWTFRQLRAATDESRPTLGHALFVLSHVVITVVSYVAVAEVTRGWLLINIWHNAQYILFVWAHHAARFRGGVDPERPFLSSLSQPRNIGRYAAVCLGLSTLFYVALGRATEALSWQVLPMVLIAHQAMNFHHYLVDAVIWRTRRARA
jgi:hypothetical protein